MKVCYSFKDGKPCCHCNVGGVGIDPDGVVHLSYRYYGKRHIKKLVHKKDYDWFKVTLR